MSASLGRIVVYVVAIVAAYGIAVEIDKATPSLFLFFIALQLSAWYINPAAGWFSSVLSIVCVAYLLLPVHTAKDFLWLLSFVAAAASAIPLAAKRWSLERSLTLAREELGRASVASGYGRPEDSLIGDARRSAAPHGKLRDAYNELAKEARALTGIELAASIAHEINQPIAAVVVQGAAAVRWLDRDPPGIPEARNSIAAVIRSGERAAAVVRRLRMLMANASPGADVVDLNEVVQTALAMSENVAAFGRQNVVCDLANDLPLVHGDRIQLELVLLNLLANAIEAMQGPSQGACWIRVRSYASDGYVGVVVADAGPGVCADAAIFSPFYSTKVDGLGMGLSICRRVIVAHRGKIEFRNGDAGGAEFEIRLPARTDVTDG